MKIRMRVMERNLVISNPLPFSLQIAGGDIYGTEAQS